MYIYICTSPLKFDTRGEGELKDLGLVEFSSFCPGGAAPPSTTDLFLYSRGCFAGRTSRCGMAHQGPDGIMAGPRNTTAIPCLCP